ncbi:putative glycosyltransferase EpsH [Methanobrevibacter cuticularis]|uniref:Putative glycosyltransferase EpsH n=1 Tax=Methanobrevibacter cuticularis TaxID=47311 RepID=A0A166DR20_9EURY|nr:glycosyltransferase family 2 protein [Methanobrevibacter cuticularis]KZX15866.1 putative glycosyltransferase EpsH [Methanobrevibacter cuticularis]
MNQKISIIIPIFNVEDYIKIALDSIINQSIGVKNLEVIIVDDCSTDNSPNIIKDYTEKYDNFKSIYLKSNSGFAGKPRNIGIQEASCDYIMFLDPDDFYENDACEVLYNTISKGDIDLAFGTYEYIFSNNHTIEEKYPNLNHTPKEKYPNLNHTPKEKYFPLALLTAMKSTKFKSYTKRKIPNLNHTPKEKYPNLNHTPKEKYVNSRTNIDPTIENKQDSTQKNRKNLKLNNIAEAESLLAIHPSIWSKIFRKKFIIENNIHFPENIPLQDEVFVVEALLKAKGIIYLDDFIVANYVFRANSITHSLNSNYFKGFIESEKLIYQLFRNHGKESYFKIHCSYTLDYLLSQFYIYENNYNNKTHDNEIDIKDTRNHVRRFLEKCDECKLMPKNKENMHLFNQILNR